LKYLTDHPKDTEVLVNSGLWKNAASINFFERLAYVKQNELQYMGFVGYMSGNDLALLHDDKNVEIVSLYKVPR
jgi:hypothetical protein